MEDLRNMKVSEPDESRKGTSVDRCMADEDEVKGMALDGRSDRSQENDQECSKNEL